MKWKRLWYWLVIPLSVFSVLLLLWRTWPQPRSVAYRLYREQGRERALVHLSGYHQERSERFELYFSEADREVADLVLETAEGVYDSVVEQVGFRPSGRVPIILYPSRQELRAAFGWGNGESALGVYWHGTIRLLSPNVWIKQADPMKQKKAFRKLNPIAHELTHYVLDHLTHGNYPRWFTEGLAQRVERKVTGFLWIEPSSTLNQSLYTLEDLRNRFDQLQNQPLAYRQSYLLVEYMVETYGEEPLTRLIQSLGKGVPFDRAVQETYGRTVNEIYSSWLDWVEANFDRLEKER
ncbi:MAG: peptidase MA family metallohydrolase [Bacillota bacterium]